MLRSTEHLSTGHRLPGHAYTHTGALHTHVHTPAWHSTVCTHVWHTGTHPTHMSRPPTVPTRRGVCARANPGARG